MLSSNDIAQMFAAQQQLFAANNYFAQSVGIMTPSMGLGAYGGAPGGLMPGGFGAPPVMSFAPGGFTGPGYGSGNRFAGNIMSGASGLGTALGVGAGLATMFGPLQRMAPLIDPFSAFGAARGMGMGMAGSLGAAAVPLALGAGVSMAAGAFFGGAHQQQMVGSQLGGFSFINPLSRTGQGFTREDASNIGGAIRSLSHIPDMMTSVEELTRLLPRMRQMGVMSGVKDAAEFNRRFKETVTTIRDMSRILGSTMEEAATFFEQSRTMGFSSRQSQLQNALNAQFTSGFTGMTMGETMGMQAGGAAAARSFGARGVYGATGVTNMAQRIQAGLESGAISQDLLTDVTGMAGPESVNAGAQRMYQFMQGLSQTSAGQVIMAGAMKRDENGRVVLDQDVIGKLNRGSLSVEDLKARAGRLSENDKISFKYGARNLGAQFAGSVDFGRFMQGLVGNKGDDAAAYMIQQYSGGQMSEQDISLLMGMGKGSQGVDFDNFKQIRSREMSLNDRTDPAKLWQRIKTRMSAGLFGGIEQAGADVFSAIGKSYDEFFDDLVGRYVITLSKEGAKTFQQAMQGGNASGLKELFAAAHGLPTTPGPSGFGASLLNSGLANGLRSFGNPTTNGLTATGQYQHISNLFGASGASLDSIISKADRGGFQSLLQGDAAIAATDAISEVQRGLLGRGYRDADMTKKIDMLRGGIADTMSSGILKLMAKNGRIGRGDPTPVIRKALMEGNTAEVESILGMSLEQAASELGGTSAGSLITAAVAAKRGGVTADFITGGMMVTRQAENQLKVRWSEGAVSSDDAARFDTVARRTQARRDAESVLNSNLSGSSVALIRGNSTVRNAINDMFSSGNPAKRRELEAAVQLSNPADVVAAFKKHGHNISEADVDDIKKFYDESRADPDAVRKAVGTYTVVSRIEDSTALSGFFADTKRKLLGGAGMAGLDSTSAGIVRGLAGAVGGIAAKGGELSDVQAMMSQAVAHYGSLSDEARSKFVAALGPAGQAVETASAAVSGLRGKMSLSKIAKKLRMSEEDAQLLIGGPALGGGDITITKDIRDRVRMGMANGYFASNLARGGQADIGGAGTSADPLMQTLNKMQQTSELQIAALAMLISGKKGADGIKEGQAILDAARSASSDPRGNVTLSKAH